MPSAPVFAIDLPVSAPWVALVRILAGLGLLATLTWWAGPVPERLAGGLQPALVLGAGACCVLAWRSSFIRSCRLRLDGAGWSLARQPDIWREGRLRVAMDLGGLLLLRFDEGAASGHPGARSHWLAVDRLGLGGQWHALRCAVYSAPPRTVTRPPG